MKTRLTVLAGLLRTPAVLTALAVCSLAASARPPFTIDWDTLDGGGAINLTGGTLTVSLTLGQPDAHRPFNSGTFDVMGGFWAGFEVFCPADFNKDSNVDFFDYLDFVAAFDSESPAADFNGDSAIDFFDYLDFVAAFDTGC
jgi:hypothetical protein